MKIEIGESLLVSWLKHVKGCKIAATNWKASSSWEVNNRALLDTLMRSSLMHFKDKYGYTIYKGTLGLEQLLSQAEIDVLGIDFNRDPMHIYAVDVAFHESGLQYGSRDETAANVTKKILRAAMCIYGFFNRPDGTIIFASPKINPTLFSILGECVKDIVFVLNQCGLCYDISIVANSDFSDTILRPVLNVLGDIADTSELFVRSLQMYNMFTGREKTGRLSKNGGEITQINTKMRSVPTGNPAERPIAKTGNNNVVRTVLTNILERGGITENEIALMLTREYSVKTFGLPCPLLCRAKPSGGKIPANYYPHPVSINGNEYYICSEWSDSQETGSYLSGWLDTHICDKNSE